MLIKNVAFYYRNSPVCIKKQSLQYHEPMEAHVQGTVAGSHGVVFAGRYPESSWLAQTAQSYRDEVLILLLHIEEDETWLVQTTRKNKDRKHLYSCSQNTYAAQTTSIFVSKPE